MLTTLRVIGHREEDALRLRKRRGGGCEYVLKLHRRSHVAPKELGLRVRSDGSSMPVDPPNAESKNASNVSCRGQ